MAPYPTIGHTFAAKSNVLDLKITKQRKMHTNVTHHCKCLGKIAVIGKFGWTSGDVACRVRNTVIAAIL